LLYMECCVSIYFQNGKCRKYDAPRNQ
jgi:hypothetical protein